MELFRSESMELVRLIVPSEASRDTVACLGDVGLVQFRDLNHAKPFPQRAYASRVKRCDEMLRRLRFFAAAFKDAGIAPRAMPSPETSIDFDDLETRLTEAESETRTMSAAIERLRRNRAELVELQVVTEKARAFFDEATDGAGGLETLGDDALLASADDDVEKASRLGFIAGCVRASEAPALERMAFRATRGNLLFERETIEGEMEDPATGDFVVKTAFLVFFSGQHARDAIAKIADSFGANRYPLQEDFSRRRRMRAEVAARETDLQQTLRASTAHRDDLLRGIARAHAAWMTFVRKQKATYHALNMFSVDVARDVVVAEAWCPTFAKPAVRDALLRANRSSSALVGTIFQPLASKEEPPTYFRTNKVTAAFQGIVDAYGIARYKEVNPTVLTIVTFPFLFAVMFGDFGHGILMLLAAMYMVLNEETLGATPQNEIFQMAFDGRYVVLLMSIFSMYAGAMYNECFSVPMTWLAGKTRWVCDANDATKGCDSQYVAGLERNGTYAFGVDPIWRGSKSELPFLNSMKMKMSIIMGVTQMMVGIFMSLLNFVRAKDVLSIACECIPQVIFLGALFGYLVFLIVLKWITPGCEADLYHVLIYMFLDPGNVDCAGEGPGGTAGCPENVMFRGQGVLQVCLVVVAFASVPVMLLPKPLVLKRRHDARARGEAYARLPGEDEDGEAFNFGDVFVHQMIHTIEFVLGAVSNTASYLRLWALSLAHSQLSAVFLDRVLMASAATKSPLVMLVGFAVWAVATIGVLMLMESLSAFLHALRLHWVEYQNKFYKGDGYAFDPFSFESILKEAAAEGS